MCVVMTWQNGRTVRFIKHYFQRNLYYKLSKAYEKMSIWFQDTINHKITDTRTLQQLVYTMNCCFKHFKQKWIK